MGLFSRKEPESGTARRSTSRSSLSSEAQANELRGRARRRLIGALALVLAAVIIVPMLFDSPAPEDGQISTPVVVPAIVPPDTTGGEVALAPATPAMPETPVQPDTLAPTVTVPASEPSAPAPEQAKPQPPTPPEPKPVEKPEPESKPKPKPSTERSDDGSVAIALLEGRSPAGSQPAATAEKGSFILQIAAYTTDKDAQIRRDRLVASGVTNAYVEHAVSGGKATYRLRVGPFPTRDAAQAAQARLRALGYDNGFISTK